MKQFFLMTILLGGQAQAADVVALARIYGARETASHMRMSPSGDRVLYFTPAAGHGTAVVVADVATGKTNVVLSAEKATVTPTSCGWKSETRIICAVSFVYDVGAVRSGFNRSLSVAADGSSRVWLGQRASDKALEIDNAGATVIDWLPDDPDNVLMKVNIAEQSNLGSNIGGRPGGISVQRVNVVTGRMTQVEAPKPNVFDYATDNRGNVRFQAAGDRDTDGYQRDRIQYRLRPKAGAGWQSVASASLSGRSGFEFLGFDESGDNLIVARDKDGRKALFLDPADGSTGKLLVANAAVDVDDVLRVGKYRRPVAAIYTVEGTVYDFFDPVLERRSKALSNALPGKPPVTILDESWDGKRNLIFAGGITDAGQYYRYDSATKQLAALMPVRPQTADLPAGPQTSVQYPAADGTLIPAFLTVPPGPSMAKRPAIIMPHGGPEYRDSLGFDWLVQYFTQLGYVVLQPNFRGSAGYGEAWYAQNGFKSWPIAIGDVNAGAHWLVAKGIADPARIAIFGWSYGGYAALQAAAVEPQLYKAVVAVAPVTDLALLKTEAQYFTNYTVVSNMIGDGPHVGTGSPTHNADKIVAPVLMFQGDRDLNVDIAQGRAMDAALTRAGKRHEFIVYPGLEHSLVDSDVRADLLAKSAQWIDAAISH